jgi:phage FluMu protein Com
MRCDQCFKFGLLLGGNEGQNFLKALCLNCKGFTIKKGSATAKILQLKRNYRDLKMAARGRKQKATLL